MVRVITNYNQAAVVYHNFIMALDIGLLLQVFLSLSATSFVNPHDRWYFYSKIPRKNEKEDKKIIHMRVEQSLPR